MLLRAPVGRHGPPARHDASAGSHEAHGYAGHTRFEAPHAAHAPPTLSEAIHNSAQQRRNSHGFPELEMDDEHWLVLEAIHMANLTEIFANTGSLQRESLEAFRVALLHEVGKNLYSDCSVLPRRHAASLEQSNQRLYGHQLGQALLRQLPCAVTTAPELLQFGPSETEMYSQCSTQETLLQLQAGLPPTASMPDLPSLQQARTPGLQLEVPSRAHQPGHARGHSASRSHDSVGAPARDSAVQVVRMSF